MSGPTILTDRPVGGAADPATFVRPELRALPEYTLDLSACRWKLDQNELPWEPPRAARAAVAALVAERPWRLYPDFHADRLRAALAERLDWPAEGILAGNGSNELLALAIAAIVPPGGEVLGFVPSFGLYPAMVRQAGGRPVLLPPREDLAIPVDELAAAIDEDPRRPVVVCSPNNPTGAAVPPEALERLLARLEAPLLLDEAYVEFSRFDARPLLDRWPNLVIFRTFSKAWGLAGFRVGYLLADPRLVSDLKKVKLPYNLDPFSTAAAVAVLEEAPALERRVRVVRARRAEWAAMLARHGFTVHPSEANFLLVRSPQGPEGARRVFDGLAVRGIRVRNVGRYPGLAGCLRVSVGSGPALRAVDAALTEVMR